MKNALPQKSTQCPCAICGEDGACDCFIRGVVREGSLLALPGQSDLRFYYCKCFCCEACFQKIAQFNHVRARGIGFALLSLAVGLGGVPLLAWLADVTKSGLAVPPSLWVASGVIGVVSMLIILGATSEWVRNNQGTILNSPFEGKLLRLARVDHLTSSNFPNFTRRPIDNVPHPEI